MKKGMIVVNPSSGSEQAEKYVDQLKAQLQSHFEQIVVNKTTKAGDAIYSANKAAFNQFDALF
ncbi:diacylglycerol kinase family protein, partial [Carnobacterium sp.]|uniref:diacylglycerol kinase family protein n=1 Tax=Carnobacterium sp. TaxID=48221 RepID=UPI0028AFB4C1